jgi:hypothetical protein
MQLLLLAALTRALIYLRVLLFSKEPAHWLSLCQKLTWPQGLDYLIAPYWRALMDPKWGSLLDRPSPLALDRATKQLSIERSLSQHDAAHTDANGTQRTRVFLNFPAKGKSEAPRRRTTSKRGRAITIEFLRVAMPPGTKLPSNKYWLTASRDVSDMAADQHGWKNSRSNGARNIAPSGKPSNNIT